MSSLALMGMVQAFVTPGNCSASSISWTSPSKVVPGRHWSAGFNVTVTSIMLNGAGSVEVSARPALPNTRSTSGNAARRRSIC
jgi:hypothetical protein